MSNAATTNPIDGTLLQKYAPTIFAAAVTLFGGLQVLVSTGHGLVEILQFTALLVTTITTFQLRGYWKIGLEVAGVLVSAVLPFAIDHTFTWANALLVAVAVTKALATHFGVLIRGDASVVPAAALGLPTFAAAAPPAVYDLQPGEVISNDATPVPADYQAEHVAETPPTA